MLDFVLERGIVSGEGVYRRGPRSRKVEGSGVEAMRVIMVGVFMYYFFRV